MFLGIDEKYETLSMYAHSLTNRDSEEIKQQHQPLTAVIRTSYFDI